MARVQLNIRGAVEQSHPADVGTSALINNFMLFSFCLWLVVVHPHIYDPTHKDLRSEHQTISIALTTSYTLDKTLAKMQPIVFL